MNVLIVDDSVIFRTGISQALADHEDIKVVGTASHGRIALDKMKNLSVDVLVIDLEMPEMDGLTTIKEIRKSNSDLSIIVFSDQSEYGAKKTFECLEAGANDFLPKSIVKEESNSVESIRKELLPRILQFKNKKVKKEKPPEIEQKPIKSDLAQTTKTSFLVKPNLILIGSSTGGPDALRTIFTNLKSYQGCPILIVQHMPPIFTNYLAKILASICGWEVKEAVHGEIIKSRTAYIAPGDYHMKVKKQAAGLAIELTQTEKVKSVRPAADVLFNSVAEIYKEKILCIVLTGMGDDGLNGVKTLKEGKNHIVIQDKESSVVWGMPGAIHAENCYNEIGNLEAISKIILGE